MIKIEASQRLMATQVEAQELHNALISEQAGKKHCTTYTRELQKSPKLFKTLGTKDGIEMMVMKDTPFQTIVMVDNAEVIAYLELVEASGTSYSKYYRALRGKYYIAAELFITTPYRGKKLATALHLGAMHVFKKLASDINMAVGAFTSFKSLEKFGYNLGLMNGTEGKAVDFTWGADGIPEIDGKLMTDIDDDFFLYTK